MQAAVAGANSRRRRITLLEILRRAAATGTAPRRVQATRADRLPLARVPIAAAAAAQVLRVRNSTCGSRLCSHVLLTATEDIVALQVTVPQLTLRRIMVRQITAHRVTVRQAIADPAAVPATQVTIVA